HCRCQPTETERCIESLLAVFQRYAGREGNSCTLSKREFRAFMDTELAAFTKARERDGIRGIRGIGNQKDPGVVDRMMKKLDMNSDGQLDFQEFLNLIGGIAVACHESLILKSPNP
ncbi:S10AB protein, partial [Buphagus erythrorhynchus]|nr:S10AB protein [Buphagus erythrorhynchus]